MEFSGSQMEPGNGLPGNGPPKPECPEGPGNGR